MGKNKLKKFSDMASMEFVLQYPYGELQKGAFPYRGRWNDDFFHNPRPIVIELGCGRGEYTVGLARRNPDKNFIGIDIKGARMWTGACQIRDEHLENAAFLRTDIELLQHFFAPGEVAEIWITFPDPQMKKVRKRLTSTRFIQLYRNILASDGMIHLKTDSPFLYTYTREMTRENSLRVLEDTSDLYSTHAGNEILAIRTYYEQQWLDRGLTIKYLAFIPGQDSELREPPVEIEHDTYRSYSRGEIQCPQLCNPKIKPKQTEQ